LAAVCSRKEPCLVHPQFVDQSDFHVDRLFLGGFRRGLDGNISVAVAVAVSARRLRTDADCRRATSRRTPALAKILFPSSAWTTLCRGSLCNAAVRSCLRIRSCLGRTTNPMVTGARKGVCSCRVSCGLAKSRDDDGLLLGHHLTGRISSTKVPKSSRRVSHRR
jgi:hypothetical protein